MIDEPEISMHPKWEQKILSYYKGLFTNQDTQFAQLLFATHSEHVLKEALKGGNNHLVMVLKDNNGTIETKK